jgi:nucleoside-diphosphate-sugar epimerase
MPAVVVDTSRAGRLGYAPAYDLAAGLAATWEDFVANGGGGAP